MKKLNKIHLHLHSNINHYKLLIYDSNTYSNVVINGYNEVITINTDNVKLIIVATPLFCDNNTSIYFMININKKNSIDLYLNFNKQINTNIDLNTFYLTDKTYGIPLNGILYFEI